MKKLKVKSSRLHQGGYFSFREDLMELQDGKILPINTLLLGDAVVVLAQDKEGRWILNREYRHSTGETILGCPGGRLEPGEDPIEGGKREFLEETGYSSDDVVLLGCCYPFPGVCNQKIYHLYARDAEKKGAQSLDPLEEIEVELLGDKELRDRILRGEGVDGILLTALWYKSLLGKRSAQREE